MIIHTKAKIVGRIYRIYIKYCTIMLALIPLLGLTTLGANTALAWDGQEGWNGLDGGCGDFGCGYHHWAYFHHWNFGGGCCGYNQGDSCCSSGVSQSCDQGPVDSCCEQAAKSPLVSDPTRSQGKVTDGSRSLFCRCTMGPLPIQHVRHQDHPSVLILSR